MGVVYEAEDPNIGRRIALKVVRTDQIGANRDEVLRRFKNEAKAAGNLSHPNIITIHDAGEHEGLLYIAMEFVEGTNLAELIAKQGRLPAAKVVDITRQVCAGLDFAHTRGIIHRDVKPANIMLTDSRVKITDFGIANVGDGMTITGTVVGTPNYMSPEQVLGKPLDGRSDLFSVGVILYEMVTGERPFEGQSITTIMYKIVHEEPIAPRKLDSTIHPGLSSIVERALAKAPEARFQTGAELAGALEKYQQAGTASVALTGNEPTASLPVLAETATLTQSNFRTDTTTIGTQQAAYPTVQQPPPTASIEPQKKRGFSTFMLGCFGLVALGIVAMVIITVVAVIAQRGKPHKSKNTTAEQTENQEQPPAPPSAGGENGRPTPTTPNAIVVEKAPAKPAQKKATVKLNSNPPGADIIVDGKSTGKETPDTLTVDRGQHTIAIRMGGFKDASAKFKVSGGEEFEFAPELTPETGGMTIPMPVIPDVAKMMGPNPERMMNLGKMKNTPGLSAEQRAEIDNWAKWGEMQKSGTPNIMMNSHPEGARIIVDGKDSGQKTPTVLPASNGHHNVRLELDGYAPYEATVEVGAPNRGPAMINARLRPHAPKSPASPEPPQ